VDLETIRRTADADADTPVALDDLPWPDAPDWTGRLRDSDLVGDDRPLRLEGSTLYLDRYWSDECQVAADLLVRADARADGVDRGALADGVSRLLGGATDPLQRLASVASVMRRFAVVAGGPGTGKTTTVARILALLDEQAIVSGARLPLVAIGAPTGKAAARLEQAVREEADRLDTDESVKKHLKGLAGTTLHRLLGRDAQSNTRFRHNRLNPLPHDVVIVDETSMVSLSMMSRLVEAVRADARLILVGDPEQLASVEAGAVLGDVVGPATLGLRMTRSARAELAAVAGTAVEAVDPPRLDDRTPTPIGEGIVVLRRVHRFGADIARLASAVKTGDSSAALEVLSGGGPAVTWIAADLEEGLIHPARGPSSAQQAGPDDTPEIGPVRDAALDAGSRMLRSARTGDVAEAISALNSFRLLCAHKRGPAGARTWASHIERWLTTGIEGFVADSAWYVGRPLLVTSNDYGLGLYNGDTGVVVADEEGRAVAAFEQGAQVLRVSPSRLDAVETVYAMTVHKSQGSQFDTVALLLPGPDSPILTRELLYTAVTRAKERVMIVGSELALRTAIDRPIARSSGLRRRLWGA
jgi:exodeoxyribonuclease V alpha subunit